MADSIYLPEALEPKLIDNGAFSPPLDLSHHFSRVTKARQSSNVKKFYKYFLIPGIGNLAGGLPNASLFPYDTLEAGVALPQRFKPTPNKPNTLDDAEFKLAAATISDPTSSSHIVVPHVSSTPDPMRKIDITTALQYGQATGYPPLLSFIREFAREYQHPNIPYLKGAEVILTNGSTDGFAKALECLSNVWSEERDWVREREGILCEEFAYMSAIQTAKPRGLQVVPVKIDEEGMLAAGPGGLEDVLENWDYKRGKRPHLMYTVTIGQNPTSGTLSIPRRKEIYALCCKYDIMIIEDDPYWYLQFPSAASSQAKARNLPPPLPLSTAAATPTKSSGFPFLDSLIPSYLTLDTQGRVLRLDTFSKTVAPGCRLGYITAQPAIIERLLRITESSTQQPSGFAQSLVAELLIGPGHANPPDGGRGGAADGMGWKFDGWVRWLAGLRGVYERRMSRMSSILDAGRFALKQQSFTSASDEDSDWAVVSKVQMYDFSWPSAGMFIWLEFCFETHPLWGLVGGQKLSEKLWVWLTKKPYLVLVAPGTMFAPTEEIAREKGWRFVRLCFAAVDEDEVEGFAERFAKGVETFWRLRKRSELDGIEDDEDVEGRVESEAVGGWMC